MGVLKTFRSGALALFCAALLPVTAGAQVLPAVASTSDGLARMFAACTGRYSAMMEHDWLMGRSGAEARASREMFLTLLDAVQHDSGMQGRDILHLRISAKHAHASLLQLGDLGQDPDAARRATLLAQQHIGQCRSVLLG